MSLSDKALGLKLKQLCKDYCLTQATLAKFLCLKNQQVASELLNGNKHFTDEMIIAICDFFKISVLEFIGSSFNGLFSESFTNTDEHRILMQTNDPELKMLIYKKWLLQSQLTIEESKLKLRKSKNAGLSLLPSKHHIYVII